MFSKNISKNIFSYRRPPVAASASIICEFNDYSIFLIYEKQYPMSKDALQLRSSNNHFLNNSNTKEKSQT